MVDSGGRASARIGTGTTLMTPNSTANTKRIVVEVGRVRMRLACAPFGRVTETSVNRIGQIAASPKF